MLINDHFKTDLYSAFSDELLKNWTLKGDYCITRASHVAERTNGKEAPIRILRFYAGMNFLEKADNRIVLHIRDSVIMKKREKILVRTVDSDDVVILMDFLYNFYSTAKLSNCQLT